jgi:hypothetical protein
MQSSLKFLGAAVPTRGQRPHRSEEVQVLIPNLRTKSSGHIAFYDEDFVDRILDSRCGCEEREMCGF